MLKQISDNNGKLIAIINNSTPDKTTFITDNDCTQQVGYITHKKDTIIPRHYHKQIIRSVIGMTEVLYIIDGKCLVDVYDNTQSLIESIELKTGDLAVFTSGGHGFRMIEDTKMLEIKHGPYIGLDERIRF